MSKVHSCLKSYTLQEVHDQRRAPAEPHCHQKLQALCSLPSQKRQEGVCVPRGIGVTPSDSPLQTGSHCWLMGAFGASVHRSQPFIPQVPRVLPSTLIRMPFLQQVFSSFWKFLPFLFIPHLSPLVSLLFNCSIFDLLILASMSFNFSFPFSIFKHLCLTLGESLSQVVVQSPTVSLIVLICFLTNDFLISVITFLPLNVPFLPVHS